MPNGWNVDRLDWQPCHAAKWWLAVWSALRPHTAVFGGRHSIRSALRRRLLTPPSDMRYAYSTAAVIIWLKQLPIMSRDKGEARSVTYITLCSRICWLICQHVRDIRRWRVCKRFQRTVVTQGTWSRCVRQTDCRRFSSKPPCRRTLTVRGPWQGEVGHRYGILLLTTDAARRPGLNGDRLFQQYVVDTCAKMEQQRVNYVRFNQNNFRTWRCSGEWRRSGRSSSAQLYAYTCSL